MKIGDKVKVRAGATKWMKGKGYWLECYDTNIDGYVGEIINDYTDLPGDDSHFEVNLGFDYGVGINAKWLELV
jgi:hypothetical protein